MTVNPATQDASVYGALHLGFREERATATLPQTTIADIFDIKGGRVMITMIVGEVTTVIQTQANATKLEFDPDDTGANQDLCDDLNISADAVGTMYHISGVPTDAMRDNLNFARGGLVAAPLILKAGSIQLRCAASNTGSVKWTVHYVPVDPGAYVEAV